MKKIDFNHNWIFTQEGTDRREEVTLPHDAMIHTDRNPDTRNYFLLAGFEGGKYIYMKKQVFSQEYQNKTVILECEAVYCMSRVLVNGENVLEHPYGYTPFQVELNPYLRLGEENEIAIIADVPKGGHGRWYTGGGIYRPVNLYVGGRNYIEPNGVKVTTEAIEPAQIRVDVAVHGSGMAVIVIRKDGAVVAAKEVEISDLECQDKSKVEIASNLGVTGIETLERKVSTLIEIPDVKLWSADSPERYEAEVSLFNEGIVLDQVTETFGIRTISANPDQGLLINGVPTFLRGGCIHNDNGVMGVINNDATELHRAKNLKQSGFNAIRSAHHPMSRALMKACDEVGLYVMDEAFDHWYRPKGQNPYLGVFLEQYLSDVRAMVKDAYNHPSVIMYSIGNEIPEAGSVKGVGVGKSIVDEIHKLDTTRLTTLSPSVHWLREYLDGVPYLNEDEDQWIAKDPANKEFDQKHYMKIFMGAVLNLPDEEKGLDYPPTYIRADEDATKNLYPYLDVAGYNYYEDRYEKLHELHPERVLLGTETRGNRIVDTMAFAKKHPYLIGDFIWTLQDHLGEANCCNLRYENEPADTALGGAKCYPWLVNHGGVIDLIGTIHPAIHRYEFAWDEKKTGLYLASQPPIHKGCKPDVSSYRWTDTVEGWTYEGYEGKPAWVDAYTDAAEVEVFVNGGSVGKSIVEDYYAKIPCIYEPGELVGVGYDGNGKELYRTVVHTALKETRITAICDRRVLQSGEEDFAFIKVQITDAEGTLKLLPEREVTVMVEGEGTLQGFGSANPMNGAKFNEKTQRTYLGRLQAVIRSGKNKGNVKITFTAEGIEPEVVDITVESFIV